MAKVKARPGLDNLPFRTSHFVGRATELDRLDAAMNATGGVWLQAVHGLGGVGKSTLAAHWAATRAARHGLAPVRWISADSAASVEQGLAALATALQPATSKVLTAEALAENALQWLASHRGWLIILDNVNHVADIAPLLARLPDGRFLITSRLATVWHDATAVIRLDVLQPAESLALLTHIARAGGGGRDMNGAAALCEDLGHLPLAVEQAAAFLAQNPLLTPRAYLELLRQEPAPLYEQGGEGFTVAERTIARIWRVTLDRIREHQPLASDIMRTLAWYAPDGIPADLLEGEYRPIAVASAIGSLNAYSMITMDPAARALSVHRLVQSVARTPDGADPHRTPGLVTAARIRATAALEAAVRPVDWNDTGTWPTGRTLLPHMDAIAAHTPSSEDTDATARLLHHAGVFLLGQGFSARATAHLRRVFVHHERELGPDDVHTLACRHNLAHALEASGHVQQAAALYERALVDAHRVLGPAHPLTLAGRNNLADAHRATGDPEEALALLGPDNAPVPVVDGATDDEDLSTLSARNTRGHARLVTGDHAEATRLFTENLVACRRVLGEDHHLTLVTRSNLTAVRMAREDPARAVHLFEDIVRDMKRVMGEEHPDTLLVRGNLAGAYREAGEPDRAVALLDEVLPAVERVHGEQHGTTRALRVAFALALRAAGDPERAARLGTPRQGSTAPQDGSRPDTRAVDIGYGFLTVHDPHQALPLLARADLEHRDRLGADDPASLTVRHNLAVAHLMAGSPAQAVPLFQEILRARESSLGEDHPDTLTTRRHLADAHREAGDAGLAIPLYEQTYLARTLALGPRHTDTLSALGMLAHSHRLAGSPDLAAPLFERALDGLEQVHGPVHPDTLAARNGLAGAYQEAGEPDRAVLLYENNLMVCTMSLGESHAHTLITRHNLAVALATAGDLGRALPLLKDTYVQQRRLLGAKHPDTRATWLSLAGVYRTAKHVRRQARRRPWRRRPSSSG
ncbi:tetratricopeptide repeat protein [Streptomyces sp. NPDC015492]|uniref:tetratricopeptide repeat protein n=1 Tax=Streptomyces sp. NPDC015492 TaxID=3364958 RepID=UPI0037004813